MLAITISNPAELSDSERDALVDLLIATRPADSALPTVKPLPASVQTIKLELDSTQFRKDLGDVAEAVGRIPINAPGVIPPKPVDTTPSVGMREFADGTVAHVADMGSVILPADNPSTGAPEAPIAPPAPLRDPSHITDAAALGFGGPLPGRVTVPPPVPGAAAVTSTAPQPTSTPVPGAPVASPPAPTNAVDKRGLPWDARIHSGNHAINETDGEWRKKRNVDPALLAKIERELKALIAIPVPGGVPAASAPAAPPAPGLPPPPPVVDDPSFANAMTDITSWLAAKHFDNATVAATVQQFAPGVSGIVALRPRPDLIRAVHDALRLRVPA